MVRALGKQPGSRFFSVYLTIDKKSLICSRLAGSLATVRIESLLLSGTIKIAECTPGMKLQSVASHCCENCLFIDAYCGPGARGCTRRGHKILKIASAWALISACIRVSIFAGRLLNSGLSSVRLEIISRCWAATGF